MQVYPNPLQASGWSQIVSTKNRAISLSVIDINGKTVWTNKENIAEGNNLIALPTNTFSKGIYSLRVVSNEFNITIKFIKE